ncbi:MAG: DUF2442 domain-containing protein [Gammaproteobacteria bacterium]|nr:DUF2442 domain-containing protein [Gammaproteobacteria bacterium]
MIITSIKACNNSLLEIELESGKKGYFDLTPYISSEIFSPLKETTELEKFHNGGYFIEWECGADLSSDTIEAELKEIAA